MIQYKWAAIENFHFPSIVWRTRACVCVFVCVGFVWCLHMCLSLSFSLPRCVCGWIFFTNLQKYRRTCVHEDTRSIPFLLKPFCGESTSDAIVSKVVERFLVEHTYINRRTIMSGRTLSCWLHIQLHKINSTVY